jgi:hypothetical protein
MTTADGGQGGILLREDVEQSEITCKDRDEHPVLKWLNIDYRIEAGGSI